MDEEIFDKKYIQECFERKEYGPVELCIMKSLYKYLFLDAATLAMAVNLILKPQMQKNSYTRNVKAMLGRGVLAHTFTDKKQNGFQHVKVTVYFLTWEARKFIKARYKNIPVPFQLKGERNRNVIAIYDEAYISERLMLNKWHLGIKTKYATHISREAYCQKEIFALGRTGVPSAFRIESPNWRQLNVIAVPYGRRCAEKGSGLIKIARKIVELNNITMGFAYKNTIIVIVCSSYYEMEIIYKEIEEINDMVAGNVYFSLEADAVALAAMERLYLLERVENEIRKKYCTIKV